MWPEIKRNLAIVLPLALGVWLHSYSNDLYLTGHYRSSKYFLLLSGIVMGYMFFRAIPQEFDRKGIHSIGQFFQVLLHGRKEDREQNGRSGK